MANIPYSKVLKGALLPCCPRAGTRRREEEEEEEEEEFFNHYKNDLKRHAHTPSGDAGADLKS